MSFSEAQMRAHIMAELPDVELVAVDMDARGAAVVKAVGPQGRRVARVSNAEMRFHGRGLDAYALAVERLRLAPFWDGRAA